MEQRRKQPSRKSDGIRRPAPDRMAAALLDWYDRNRRDLPWRAASGETTDPYSVWLSEIMLQQTTVATVGPYFDRFLGRWPTVTDLAEASLDDVLHAWQGLGYYARARNLRKCARVVASEYGGRFPKEEAALLKLPGVGPYTAAAIAAIAFNKRTVPVDGNVERVMSRIFTIEERLPALKPAVVLAAEPMVPKRSGDFWQAAMDLGATVCRPKAPLCPVCPWRGACAACREGTAETYPRKAKAANRPTRYGIAFLAFDPAGAIFLRRRPPSGLLGGMIEVPSTEWRETPWEFNEALPFAPAIGDWMPLGAPVRHTFTHFHLELTVVSGKAAERNSDDGFWCLPGSLADQALPTVMKKVLRRARIL